MDNSPTMQSKDFAGERGANTRAMNRLVNTRGASAAKGKGASKPKTEPTAKAAPQSKAATTRAANKANTDRLTAMGQTAIGSRLKKSTAKSYSGTKATKEKNAQLWANAGSNKREAVRGESVGANFSKAKMRGTFGRKRK
jgi:hypothetical protein